MSTLDEADGWVDDRGNLVFPGKTDPWQGVDVSHYQNGDGLPGVGWTPASTWRDFSHFGVWVNLPLRMSFVFCEGDTFLTVCPDDDALRKEIAYLAGFHAARFAPEVDEFLAAGCAMTGTP